MLEAEDRLRVEEVRRSLAAPLVLAADVQRAVCERIVVRVGGAMALLHLRRDAVEADAAQTGAGADEELLDQFVAQAQSLECLGRMV